MRYLRNKSKENGINRFNLIVNDIIKMNIEYNSRLHYYNICNFIHKNQKSLLSGALYNNGLFTIKLY